MDHRVLWSDADKKKVSDLWSEGKTAAQIAQEFSGKSRNAIIGLMHRMRVPKREIIRREPKEKKERQLRPKRPFSMRDPSLKFKAPPTLVPPPASVTSGDGILLRQLRDHHCRDVIGYRGGNTSEAVYCGADKHGNTSFCEYHHSIYKIPPRKRA